MSLSHLLDKHAVYVIVKHEPCKKSMKLLIDSLGLGDVEPEGCIFFTPSIKSAVVNSNISMLTQCNTTLIMTCCM